MLEIEKMPWWMSAIIISVSVCLLFIFLLIVIKNNKNVDATAEIGDKSFGLQIQDSDKPEDKSDDVKKNKIADINSTEYEFIKSYMMSILDSHSLITSVFTMISNKEDINDKIYLRILKNNDVDFKRLNINVRLIQKLYKYYSQKIKEELSKSVLNIKNNLEDINSVSLNIDKFCMLFESDSFVDIIIQEFKNKGFKTELLDGESYSASTENLDDKIFKSFKNKIRTHSIELVSEIKLAKTRLMNIDNKFVKLLSVLYSVNSMYDAVLKHLYEIYFECKPAVIGDSEGV